MLHGCPPSPDAWGRLNVVTPFHHLSGDSHINSSLRAGPLRHLIEMGPPKASQPLLNVFDWLGAPSAYRTQLESAPDFGLMPVNAGGRTLCKHRLRDQDPTKDGIPWAVHT